MVLRVTNLEHIIHIFGPKSTSKSEYIHFQTASTDATSGAFFAVVAAAMFEDTSRRWGSSNIIWFFLEDLI